MSEGFGFGDFFGTSSRGRSQGTKTRGQDLQLNIKLTLEEIAGGITKKVKLKRYVHCDTCSGTGLKKGSTPAECSYCHGAGEIRQVSKTIFGQFVNVATCPQCSGEGNIVKDRCPDCSGDGRVRGESTIFR